MSYRSEPVHTHGKLPKTAVVLVNLGTPDAPTTSAVRRYLKQFLSDPRVVEIPRAIWWWILHLVILPFRSGQSAKKYDSIWSDEGSPLKVHTEKQARLLSGYLGERGHKVRVVYAMRYGNPSLPSILRQLKEEGCDRILILPAYPQYSGTTTASIFDAVFAHYRSERNVPELRFIKHYHDHEAYIEALRKSVLAHWELNGRPEKLLMSFHGVPKRTLLLGDPYHCECHKTARLLAQALGLTPEQYLVTFQSRFGKAEWLQPYTAPTVQALAREGVRKLDVICPGFTSDCLETLEEIAMEVRHDFLQAGGTDFNYIPCLNEDDGWIRAMAEVAELHMIGWPTLMTPALKEELEEQAQITREAAARLGASQ
ncbi:MAG: ferrochelatase [Oxalicibacterium faecigallinarum]|uniref:Ferrochelatase n=1 Tax=Oxalicibacterium faecigallinarum TaxID=573741 RepID=A0A8J3AZS6_9BURK|nr:ferrochelatase [Oxalicibacterium faecigallinarum]MDQ7969559.1 ferrochelatase [Oxalicibacterium faecigallinarum]GGI20378.1 ferrochelatase [Oxalicibacterium faecigallinarum]